MTEETQELVPTVPAIQALRAHIDERYGGSVSKFSRENKLDAADVSRVLRQVDGRGSRMTVAFADKIEKATSGAVTLRMWVQPGAADVE